MATVLCIDDNRNILGMNKALLESHGYRVLIAPNGPTGIALTRTHSIDVVVLDFNMPGMDGTQVAEVLMKEQPKLPVVIWSGCVDERPESLKWFADAWLHKGDGPAGLLSAVEKLVNACSTSKKRPAPRTINAREQLSA